MFFCPGMYWCYKSVCFSHSKPVLKLRGFSILHTVKQALTVELFCTNGLQVCVNQSAQSLYYTIPPLLICPPNEWKGKLICALFCLQYRHVSGLALSLVGDDLSTGEWEEGVRDQGSGNSNRSISSCKLINWKMREDHSLWF